MLPNEIARIIEGIRNSSLGIRLIFGAIVCVPAAIEVTAVIVSGEITVIRNARCRKSAISGYKNFNRFAERNVLLRLIPMLSMSN